MRAATKTAVASDELPDAELAVAVVGGDRSAFSVLFRRHAPRVHAQLTRLLGPCPERDDVMQLVFLRLHRALPEFRGDSSLSTFLYRIAVNAAYDHLKSARRTPPALDVIEMERLIDDRLDGTARFTARDGLIRLFEHLHRLSPKKRIAFALVAIEGRSLAEAATLVGCHQATLKQRVLHARRELEMLMQREATKEKSR